jgi:DNA polymerase II large subunit
MTDLPVTAVRPAELDVTAEQFRELGYERDVDGEPLRHDDQLVELRVQDVVLSDGAAEHMLKTADFVDDLLERYYGLAPFYELEDREDLVGELVFGMAPHTSAAVVGRVAGFTSAAVGYAHPYFHAAKRRNCFHPETKLWYEDDGKWEYGPLSELVDGRLAATDEVETDDVGTEYVELDDPVYVPGVTEDGENERQRVTHLSRHPAPDHMVTVEGESGNRITVTPGHDMLVYDTEEHAFAERRASEVSEDDWLVFPEEVDVDGCDPEYDLLRYFLRSDAVANDRLMVRGIGKERLERVYREATGSEGYGYIKPLAEAVGENRKTLSNYLYRDAVPASLLLELLGDADAVCARVPDGVRLGAKRDAAEIERFLELDGTLATLLGYYAAEGFTRDQAERPDKKDVRQVIISATEPESRRFALEAFDEVFGANPYEENESEITASGHLLAVVFEELFDCGTTAAGKRVPEQLFSASRENVAAYLGGYVSGDGSVGEGALVVETVTVSEQLRDGLIDLYRRLGVKADYTVASGRPPHEAFPEFYDDDSREAATPYSVRVTSEDAVRFATWNSVHLPRKRERLRDAVDSVEPAGTRRFGEALGQCLDPVASVEYEQSDLDAVYNLTTENGTVYIDKYLTYQCDGDEDCVMLLMDGLLNFSKSFLPDQRGGKMDAPLVMSSRIDPSEIDDEAHNMDIVEEYPREFYEATRRMADPGEADIRIAEETLGTDDEYSGFRHTHDTGDIAAGPSLSAYKTLGDMTEKMNHQLELARTLRAVDETDVAERVIEYHFLPDIIGNLRAFSRQEVRCLDCGHKYRRAPLTGHCRECGADRMTLTVHEGSVSKYIDTATRVAEEYGCREYTRQRLRILERAIESVFEDDTNKQSGIADFM